MTSTHTYTSTVYIESTPERIWQGLTDPEMTHRWYFGSGVDSSWDVGSRIEYLREGLVLIDGEILEIDSPYLLVSTYSLQFHPMARTEPPCRLAWTIEPLDGVVRLSAKFDDVAAGSATEGIIAGGLAPSLNTLKAILETGRAPLIANITFDCAEPQRLAAFWKEVTGYIQEGGNTTEWAALYDPRGVGPRFLFMRVPETKVVKNRMHLDIRAADHKVEAARLVTLGGRILRTVDEVGTWTVMADPEGNEFCLSG